MLPADIPSPDFYIASIGRTGSTMIANWLTAPPERIVLIEPFLFALRNPDMLRVQFDELDMPIGDEEWEHPDENWQDRFRRLFLPRLAGKRWALKEVIFREHERIIDTFAPPRVLVTVREIRDVVTSFIEKHRIQEQEDRFDHGWVEEYCLRETRQIVEMCKGLPRRGIEWRAVRYEDFIASEAERDAVAEFVGWPGGGEVARHYARLRRGFEVERHGTAINARARRAEERSLTAGDLALVERIAARCGPYQDFFGY